MAVKSAERKFLGREDSGELEVAKVDGSVVTDTRGKKYIDFVMGWCVGNFRGATPRSPSRKCL